MRMIGYLGKKVDIVCKDGKQFSGYVSDVSDAEDSDIGVDSIEISLIDQMYMVEIAVDDIAKVTIDIKYKEINFRGITFFG